MNDKIDVFGEFNMGRDAIKRAKAKIQELWNAGNVRLTPEDVKQFKQIEREIKGDLSSIKGIIELFNSITNGKLKE